MPESVNAAQAAGQHRVVHAALFDDEIRPHDELARLDRDGPPPATAMVTAMVTAVVTAMV